MDNNEKATSYSVRPAPPGQDVATSQSRSNKKQQMLRNYGSLPQKASSKEIYDSPSDLSYEIDEERMAPLGFEPEGSATKPSFSEGCSSLQEMLFDRDGFEMLYEYLRLEKLESLLDFWRSCEEFRRLSKAGSNLATPTANAIYSNYMHKKHVCGSILHHQIRAKVKHKLNSGQPLSESTFDSAQEAIVSYIYDYHYTNFLRSDVYKPSVSESVNTSIKVRVSNRATRFTGTALSPLPEEKVLAFGEERNRGQWGSYDTATRSDGGQVDGEREGYFLQNMSKAAIAGMYCPPAPPVVSVNDSDVQSLSSDALTDDSKSTVTDFSDLTSKSTEKRTRQLFHDVPGFLPRTKRLPKDRKMLSTEEFAQQLIERLEKVQIEREQEERAAVNLAGPPREHTREKSILQDAAERHHRYQQARRLGYQLQPPKFTDPCYPIHENSSIISSSSHGSYIEHFPMPSRYYPNTEPVDNASGTWRECISEKPECVSLMNTKKQWESVGTIESAPDSGVSIEDDLSLPAEKRNRIFQWMEQGEKEAQPHLQTPLNFAKTPRSKHNVPLNYPELMEPGRNVQPVAQDPLMPPLPQPNSRNTLEEASRRLSQKNGREKRSKSHQKNRPGYMSSRSSQMTCPLLSSPAMYSSSSILSSVPSTINSNDSGLGCIQKKNERQQESTTVIYYLGGEQIPYQSSLPGTIILLRQLKDLVAFKKGIYRYFFKKKTDEELCGAIYEEVTDNDAALPFFEGKIICKVKEA